MRLLLVAISSEICSLYVLANSDYNITAGLFVVLKSSANKSGGTETIRTTTCTYVSKSSEHEKSRKVTVPPHRYDKQSAGETVLSRIVTTRLIHPDNGEACSIRCVVVDDRAVSFQFSAEVRQYMYDRISSALLLAVYIVSDMDEHGNKRTK